MGVLRPLRVVIDNYPEDRVEQIDAVNNPEDASAGKRKVPFSRVLYIEQDDFREEPPRKFFRLAPGREVRLRYAYFITCREVVKDPETGAVVELHCTYDPATSGGDAPDGRKVKATLHWVSATHALQAEVRLYDHLFSAENPDVVESNPSRGLQPARTNDAEPPTATGASSPDWKSNLNPNSLEVLPTCFVEPSLSSAKPGDRYQFERLGYFCVDADSTPDKLVFNRTVTLKDTWAKIEKKAKR